MEYRRLGRTGHDSSVLIYGAAALGEVDQATADASLELALGAGINHLDVAASYGDAELRLGARMREIRDRVFLATKTGERAAEPAWAQLNRSLDRLQTDRVDLIQLHAIGDIAELDQATGPGGAVEAAVRARDEGLVRFIGITGHGHDAPATHLEALRRFDFDTVISPWNYVLAQRPDYAAAFAALVDACEQRDVGLMAIKTVARRNWATDDHGYATWYEPFDEQRLVTAALSWALAAEGVTGLPTAGDVRLLPLLIEAERNRIDREAAAEALQRASSYSSPFVAMPI